MIQSSASQTPLPPDGERRLRQALHPGETIVWAAQPTSTWIAQDVCVGAALGLWFLGVGLWAGIAGWTGTGIAASSSPAGTGTHHLASIIMGTLTASFGVLTALPSLRQMRTSMETVYAVTNQRVLILKNSEAIQSFDPAQVRARTVRKGLGGHGHLHFDCLTRVIEDNDGTGIVYDGFLGIPAPTAVDALVRRQFE